MNLFKNIVLYLVLSIQGKKWSSFLSALLNWCKNSNCFKLTVLWSDSIKRSYRRFIFKKGSPLWRRRQIQGIRVRWWSRWLQTWFWWWRRAWWRVLRGCRIPIKLWRQRRQWWKWPINTHFHCCQHYQSLGILEPQSTLCQAHRYHRNLVCNCLDRHWSLIPQNFARISFSSKHKVQL